MSWLSRLWKRENDLDRCGVGFLRTSSRDPFIQPCAKHDQDYLAWKSIKQDKSKIRERMRKLIDRDLLVGMLQVAITQDKLHSRLFHWGRAYTFYGFVRAFGWLAWRQK